MMKKDQKDMNPFGMLERTEQYLMLSTKHERTMPQFTGKPQ